MKEDSGGQSRSGNHDPGLASGYSRLPTQKVNKSSFPTSHTMSTSTTNLPSRTRSLRKPDSTNSNISTSRYGRSTTATNAPSSNDLLNLSRSIAAAPPRGSVSPSRLPVKPTTRSATTSSRPPSSNGSSTNSTSMRPRSSRSNGTKSSVAEGAGLGRSTSIRRPSDTSQTSTISSQNSIPSRRPPSRDTNTPPGTDPIKQDRSRPPLTQYKHLRNASTSSALSSSTNSSRTSHNRTKSSSTLLTNPSLRPPSRDSTQSTSTVSQNSNSLPSSQLQRKANFTTYNQHFSPAKSLAPKPASATFLIPPSPSKLPSNIAITAETAKLQNELLQLHLLHKDSVRVRQEWEADARLKLERRFNDVVERDIDLTAQERHEMSKINAQAFISWKDAGVPGLDFSEKIRMLDDILTGVWNLEDPKGGQFTRVVQSFEKYLVRTQDIMDIREDGHDFSTSDEDIFITPLPSAHHHTLSSIERKLLKWSQGLQTLGAPSNLSLHSPQHPNQSLLESTLSIVLSRLSDSVEGMLEEISIMRELENEVQVREGEWVRGMIGGDSDDEDGDGDGEGRTAGAIWRSF